MSNELIEYGAEQHNAIVQRNQAVISLKQDVFQEGTHYGEPYKGAGKPTLLKPGAELLMARFKLWPEFRELSTVEDWDRGLFHYRYECRLISQETGAVTGAGIGSCNSMEDKYRWRNAERVCPVCGAENIRKSKKGSGWYCWDKTGGCGANFDANDPRITEQESGKVPNEDPFTMVNTFDKMAQKRALVAAVLVATGASGYFTQDVEDFPGYAHKIDDSNVIDGAVVTPAPQSELDAHFGPRERKQKASPHWWHSDKTRQVFWKANKSGDRDRETVARLLDVVAQDVSDSTDPGWFAAMAEFDTVSKAIAEVHRLYELEQSGDLTPSE